VSEIGAPPPPPPPTLTLTGRSDGVRVRVGGGGGPGTSEHLLPPERINRMQPRGLFRGPDAEEDADAAGDGEGDDHRAGVDDRVPFEGGGDGNDDADAEGEAEEAAEEGDEGGLDEELLEDQLLGGAEGFADADLARALGDRHQHNVHDADP